MTQEPTPCTKPGCTGHIVVYHSRMTLAYRVQYLQCNTCKAKHGSRKTSDELLARLTLVEAKLKTLEESLPQHNTTGNP